MFDWSDKYLANDEVMDHEHKLLFELIREHEKAVLEKASREKLEDILELYEILTKIELLMQTHFEQERLEMIKWKYPGLFAHLDEHQKLLENLSQILLKVSAGDISDEAVRDFLVELSVNHILNKDMEFVEYRKTGEHAPFGYHFKKGMIEAGLGHMVEETKSEGVVVFRNNDDGPSNS